MHDKVIIRIGTDAEKKKLLNDYPHTKNVVRDGGYFIVALRGALVNKRIRKPAAFIQIFHHFDSSFVHRSQYVITVKCLTSHKQPEISFHNDSSFHILRYVSRRHNLRI